MLNVITSNREQSSGTQIRDIRIIMHIGVINNNILDDFVSLLMRLVTDPRIRFDRNGYVNGIYVIFIWPFIPRV